MKKIGKLLTLLGILALGMSSCSLLGGGDPDNNFDATMLVGKWQDDTNASHYIHFTTAVSDSITAGYQYGFEYGEDGTLQSDLVEHGNGWFEWRLTGSQLNFKNLSDQYAQGYSSLKVDKSYTVSRLTSTQLSYSNGNRTFTFTKAE